jgi:hypothetical protein
MKRRQFSAMLATATFSLGGLTGSAAGTSAQDTDPLQAEDVTVELGGVTSSVERAELAYQEGLMRFEMQEWTMEAETRSLAIDTARVTVDDVSAETFSTVRSGMVESFEGRSLSPLVSALADADFDPDSPVRVTASPVEMDGQLVVDQVTASGTVGSVVPEGSRELAQDGASLDELAALGSSEWDQLTIMRGAGELTLDDVAMELDGTTLSITSPSGTAELPDRTLELSDVTMNVRPPESPPQEHVEFASRLRQMAADETLSFSGVRSSAAESGVSASNTEEAVQDARVDLTLGEVTEDGETLISNFETSQTVAELVEVLRQQV